MTHLSDRWKQLLYLLEYLNGVHDEPPLGMRFGPVFWGLWWGVLVGLIVVFSGQTSQFIYIDF